MIATRILKSIALFLIITLGVTSGNLLSNYLTTLVAEHALKQAMIEANAEAAKRQTLNRQEAEQAKAQGAIEQERRRQQTEKQRRDAEQKRSIQKQLNETCNFWTNEYNKTRKEVDKIHRDNACKAARK